MWAALRSQSCSRFSSSSSSQLLRQWKLGFPSFNHTLSSPPPYSSSSAAMSENLGLLELPEVEKILSDVRADNVKVIPAKKHNDWADFMVIATGRSTWHVKQKQKGAKRLVLPSVEGQEGGKWIVIDSGKVVIHALDEKAREYYNLEDLWTSEPSEKEPIRDLEKALVKIRRKNNSKKPAQKRA
ncbi:Protein Iojap/ribosomal silencing factor RsfS [Parasponia andersonii]|uniref:Protein Iojap/ribosomal silencing factor RsfS n=1 Tax=Parasponia andersonii TaxID=3476 RepID=A0A2P5CUS2_PARAD|nr:Protein Iojap/ribosomal silencing factor RsfS [Parasponia andersonii]